MVCNLRSSLAEIWSWPPYAEGWERPNREADHSRLVEDSVNKQISYIRLIFGSHEISRFLPPPTRIFKVYIETLTMFNHIVSPDYLNSSLEIAASMGIVGRSYIPRIGVGVRTRCPMSSLWVNQWSHPLYDLLSPFREDCVWAIS